MKHFLTLLTPAQCCLLALAVLLLPAAAQEIVPPFKVEFAEPRTEVAEMALPVDPTLRAQVTVGGNMTWGLRVDGKSLCFGGPSIRTTFRIDGRAVQPTGVAAAVPSPAGSKNAGPGWTTSWNQGNIRIVQTLQVVPTKPPQPVPGQKRRLDAVLVTYEIENNDTVPHSVGVRAWMDAYCWNTDGPLVMSPREPNRVLNGVELKDKTLPPYVRCLSNGADFKTGFAAHFMLNMGTRYEGPDRFVHTTHVPPRIDDWNFGVQPANGDSDYILYFDPKEIPAKGKRLLAYGYGEGLAGNPANEGKVTVALRGSFEPNKLFSVAAFVEDPIEGQTLSLDLPAGMQRVEGQELQPVPTAEGSSMVLWKARVLRPGQYTLHVRSNNGAVHERTVTITAAK